MSVWWRKIFTKLPETGSRPQMSIQGERDVILFVPEKPTASPSPGLPSSLRNVGSPRKGLRVRFAKGIRGRKELKEAAEYLFNGWTNMTRRKRDRFLALVEEVVLWARNHRDFCHMSLEELVPAILSQYEDEIRDWISIAPGPIWAPTLCKFTPAEQEQVYTEFCNSLGLYLRARYRCSGDATRVQALVRGWLVRRRLAKEKTWNLLLTQGL